MGTIVEKLKYTKDAIDDIQSAINEKGIECTDSVPLKDYGEKIRDIKTHQKPTFCEWHDLGQVYYGFDESDIKFEKNFGLYDLTTIPQQEAIDMKSIYYGFDESDIKFESSFEKTDVTVVENTYNQ